MLVCRSAKMCGPQLGYHYLVVLYSCPTLTPHRAQYPCGGPFRGDTDLGLNGYMSKYGLSLP